MSKENFNDVIQNLYNLTPCPITYFTKPMPLLESWLIVVLILTNTTPKFQSDIFLLLTAIYVISEQF